MPRLPRASRQFCALGQTLSYKSETVTCLVDRCVKCTDLVVILTASEIFVVTEKWYSEI
jgi:hypothetical protein